MKPLMFEKKLTTQFDKKEKDKSVMRAKDVLDIRIVPGHPTHAWIECYKNTYDEDAKPGNAEYNAEIENQKLKYHLVEKEEKLKSFQVEVKRRVTYLQKLKKEQEHCKSLKLVEYENNVVLQRTLGTKTPYRGTTEDLQALNKELLKSCIIPCNNDKQLLQNEVGESNQKVDEIAEEIRQGNLKARSKLLLKKLETYETSLPGGNWRSPLQKQIEMDYLSLQIQPQLPPAINWPVSDNWQGKDMLNSSHCTTEYKKRNTAEPGASKLKCDHALQMEDLQGFNNQVDSLQKTLFYTYNDFGKNAENEKMQRQNQYWKYRKIFMDIERDQVRENKKRRDHRKKVQELKLVKEQERKLAELQITEFPEKPIQNEQVEQCSKSLNGANVKSKCKETREREMYRYMEALRKVAKERIEFCKVSIPPLCSCGPTFWDSHPDKCANNCIFYKNIKDYVAALTSALMNTR